MSDLDARTRWLALYVLCLASLMIVLDITVVNVALPSIKADLGFSDTSLAWVINAYLLTYGGLLLLGGRLGDLYGHRRLFLVGITVFTLASLACGLANSQGFLVVARGAQGVGGAVASAVSLSLMVNLFTEPGERAKAMGVFGFVASGGGSIGVLLGGVLTDSINWHLIFLVNFPIGVLVVLLSLRLLPEAHVPAAGRRLDVGGAVTVTGALMIAVYAIVNGNQAGWTSLQTLGLLGVALAIFAVFLVIEVVVKSPLMPLALFKLRNLATADVVGVLWAAAMFAFFFLAALYLQLVLGYSPLRVGLSFLPANLIMGALSIGVSARLVIRFGFRSPLAAGLLLAAAGMLLFARAPVDGSYVVDVLPSMILLGLGAGIAFNPVLLAAMSDVAPQEAGLASGIINTSFMMGGALGLAALASISDSRKSSLLSSGHSLPEALTGGYHLAFFVAALFAVAAAAIGGGLLVNKHAAGHEQQEAGGALAAAEAD
jgi:EmrB/QacA subfamily drug resistance transporter